MPSEIAPKKLQTNVQKGFDRFRNFRNARLLFLRSYVGQYYDRTSGEIGTEALNLIFNAIRVLIPNIVMSYPTHNVNSRWVVHREYARMLEMALSFQDQEIDIKDVYRRVIVDAVFTLGILKTGLAESDTIYALDEYDSVDAGSIYTEAVDFDNFVVDPASRDYMFRDAAYMGDRIYVPRSVLLDSGLYKNDLVERLPSIDEMTSEEFAHNLSQKRVKPGDDTNLRELVAVTELWVPEANAIVTVPGTNSVQFDDYLRIDDYYGPDTGPYTLLSLTPPVPGNPLPVPAVGVWYDLHVLANRMAKKIIDQAERQKSVMGYKRSAADDAQEALDAADGEAVAMDDPDGIRTYDFGGQQQTNEIHLAQLNNWFSTMAANPEALGGSRTDADSATEARILAQNASVHLRDMQDMVYQMSAAEARKRAWYLHTDPFIELPLVQRQRIPAEYQASPQGPVMVSPAREIEQQVFLTPEARSGDFLDFTFSVEPESMSRKDEQARYAEAMEFAVKILPAAMQAAMVAMQLGIPFSARTFIEKMARDRGIDWIDQVFLDPETQMQTAALMMRGPQAEGSQGVPGGAQQAGPSPQAQRALQALLQNGQPGQVMGGVPAEDTQDRQQAQAGANEVQRMLKGPTTY